MKSLDNSMKIKPRTYYKIYYNEDKEWYNIVYTGNKWVYEIASKYFDEPLTKYSKKPVWGNIKDFQKQITLGRYDIEEISKEDLFLELL